MKKFIRVIIVLIGIGIGPAILAIVNSVLADVKLLTFYDLFQPWANLLFFVVCGIISGIIFIIISPKIVDSLFNTIRTIEHRLSVLPASVVFSGVLGLIVGLLISYLLSGLINNIPIPWVSTLISVLVYIMFSYLGVSLAVRRKSDMHFFGFTKGKNKDRASKETPVMPKILDTSVIIDGRIFDLCKTGFIEGTLVIPEFVLEELRHIADSSDTLKRNRGRRGLDVLNRIQKELDLPVAIQHTEGDENLEVDSRLLRLAKEINGKVVTNDYNLNKVASVQSVQVLNINELANAIKPVVLPGEDMTVQVVKDGKEARQGIAYLDDGTMIVVEGGKGRQGEDLRVLVTSVLQTAAGRMIFARCKDAEE